jgi:CBS domain-containing protein
MEQKDYRENNRGRLFDHLTVGEFMKRDVRYGHPHTTGDILASLMVEGGFGSIPIVDSALQLLGIVSEFDLLTALSGGRRLSALHSGKELGDLVAEHVMTYEPVRVTPETDVLTAMYVLQTNHLIRVPVVDQEGRLVGIVARRDILNAYLHSVLEAGPVTGGGPGRAWSSG